jgi:PEGA domain
MRLRNTTSAAAALLCVWALTANLSAQRAVPRGGSSGGSTPSGGHSSGGGSGGSTPSGGSSGGGQRSGGAVQRAPSREGGSTAKGGGTTRDTAASTPTRSNDDENESSPTTSRGREGTGSYGKAVPRRGAPPRPHDGDDIFVSGGYYGGYYPWGWSGIGFGGYYGGYYDPWYYGGGYPQVYSGSYNDYDGMLRLKMKPREAQVFVDGYFVGVVDDFDGMWQRLHVEPGPHRVEVRLDNYETLMFEVNIQPDKTVTYTGELRRIEQL